MSDGKRWLFERRPELDVPGIEHRVAPPCRPPPPAEPEPIDRSDRKALNDRPRERGECADGSRPCPYVRCRHHLYIDVNPETGSIKLNFPDLEVWELKDSCSLDVADRGGITLEEVGEVLNVTRERIRQIEKLGLSEMRSARRRLGE